MKIENALNLVSVRLEKADRGQLKTIYQKLNALRDEIKRGPMRKVFEACGGHGVDVPAPPMGPLFRFLQLKATISGRLVEENDDKSYKKSCAYYERAIQLAEES